MSSSKSATVVSTHEGQRKSSFRKAANRERTRIERSERAAELGISVTKFLQRKAVERDEEIKKLHEAQRVRKEKSETRRNYW